MADAPEESEETPEEPAEPPVAEDGTRLSEYADPGAEVDQEVRRYPSTIGGVFFLLVLAGTFVGLVLAWDGRWRVGVGWIGLSLLAAAAIRLVLPESQTGMLHVRRRLVDVFLLVVLGAGILALAFAVPR